MINRVTRLNSLHYRFSTTLNYHQVVNTLMMRMECAEMVKELIRTPMGKFTLVLGKTTKFMDKGA